MAKKLKKVIREKPIPQAKIKAVEEMKKLLKTKRTVLIASIKNLPAAKFQEISKELRGKAIVKVPKKSISIRAIDSHDKVSIKPLKEQVKEDVALLFSDLDSFELAAELINEKQAAKAKAGQIAPDDIVIEPRTTDLPPGPAISELGALGLKVAVEGGKIAIKERKVLVKKGEPISAGAASLMGKLDIKPFKIGFDPIAAYDAKDEKIYVGMNIDKEGTIKNLKESFSKALGFAVNIAYTNEETIKFIIAKAGSHERALSALMKHEGKEEGK